MMTKITMNSVMASSCISSRLLQSVRRIHAIQERVDRVVFTSSENCYFIEYLHRQSGNATLSHFPDETGYECYVNHFHIDDCPIDEQALVALSLCVAIGERWRLGGFGALALRQIVSYDGNSCVYRCHVIREGQSWLADDLDSYQEPIFVVDTEP